MKGGVNMKANTKPNVFDIIDSIGADNTLEVFEVMKKIDYINKKHPYAITHHEATTENPRDYFIKRLADGKKRQPRNCDFSTKEKSLRILLKFRLFKKMY